MHAVPIPRLDTDDPQFWRGFEVGANYVALSTIPIGQDYLTTVLQSNVENLSRIAEKLGLDYHWHESDMHPSCMQLYARRMHQ